MRLQRSNFPVLLLLLLITASFAHAGTFYSKAAGGNWNAASTWVTACGGSSGAGSVPTATDDVTICSGTVYMNATESCKSLTVNSGGVLTFNTTSVTLSIASSMTIGSGGIVNYTALGTSVTVNLGGNLSCTSTGTFSLVRNSGQYGTLVFNGSSNASVSGTGNITLNAMTLNTGSASTSVTILTNTFSLGNPYYFKLTRGTFKWNNSGTLTDCYNSGSNSRLTIPYGVVLESDAGIMNFCRNGQPTLSGGIVLNGGIINIASSTGGQTDLEYLDNGGTPQLYVNTGTLNVYGGINDNGSYSNYLDFEMTGGTINLSLGGQSPNNENLMLNNLAGGKTIMSAGLITLEECANNSSTLDLDFGGPAIGALGSGTYNVTGGTIQFGTVSSAASANEFWFEAHASNNYPNMLIYGSSPSTSLVKPNNTSNFIIQSLNMSTSYTTFDMRDASGGLSNQMTINGTNGTGAFLNSGTFTQRTSTVNFNGTMQQAIGPAGGNTTTFHNVIINNTSGTTTSTGVIQQVATHLDATGVMTFTNGSYSLNSFTLTIQNGATGALTGGSASSYLISEDQTDGTMASALQWNIGNAASGSNFIIPFGFNGSYIPFTFGIATASGNTGTTLTLASYESANGTTLPFPSMAGQVVTSTNGALANAAGCHPNTANNSDLIVNRYWEITAGTQASLVANLTFSYLGSENQTIALCGGSTGGKLSPQRWDVSGGFWGAMVSGVSTLAAVYGTGTNGVTTGVGTVSAGGINTFSPWILVTTASPLPVELLSFGAKANSTGNVEVSWETASETNNAYFIIERSDNGEVFDGIERVSGAGNSSSVLRYGITDRHPLKGISYYRLKQTDYDGKITYSAIVPVNLKQLGFAIYPNPAEAGSTPYLVFDDVIPSETVISVMDLTGKCIYTQTLNCKKDRANRFNLDALQNLSHGMYLIVASTPGEVYKQKIVIE